MSGKDGGGDEKELTTGQLLFRASKLARMRVRVHLDRLGIHRGQGFILWRLGEREGLSQGELANGLNVTPATVSGTLRRMEEAGWVVRRSDAVDRRISRVYLTGKGQALVQELVNAFRTMEQELLAGFSAEEERAFREALEKVRSNFCQNQSTRVR